MNGFSSDGRSEKRWARSSLDYNQRKNAPKARAARAPRLLVLLGGAGRGVVLLGAKKAAEVAEYVISSNRAETDQGVNERMVQDFDGSPVAFCRGAGYVRENDPVAGFQQEDQHRDPRDIADQAVDGGQAHPVGTRQADA